MKQVIIFPRGQLNAKDKKKLANEEIIAIEADKPSDVVMLLPSLNSIRADDLLMSALKAVRSADLVEKSIFFDEFYSRIKNNHKDGEEK